MSDMIREKGMFGNPLEARKFCKNMRVKGQMYEWIVSNGGAEFVDKKPTYLRIPTERQIIEEIYEPARVRSNRMTKQQGEVDEMMKNLRQELGLTDDHLTNPEKLKAAEAEREKEKERAKREKDEEGGKGRGQRSRRGSIAKGVDNKSLRPPTGKGTRSRRTSPSVDSQTSDTSRDEASAGKPPTGRGPRSRRTSPSVDSQTSVTSRDEASAGSGTVSAESSTVSVETAGGKTRRKSLASKRRKSISADLGNEPPISDSGHSEASVGSSKASAKRSQRVSFGE